MCLLRSFQWNLQNHVEWDKGVHQLPLPVSLQVQEGIGEDAQCPKEVSGSDVPRIPVQVEYQGPPAARVYPS